MVGQIRLAEGGQVRVESAPGNAEVFDFAQIARLVFPVPVPEAAPFPTRIEPAQPQEGLPPGWQVALIGRVAKSEKPRYQVEDKKEGEAFGAFQFRASGLGPGGRADSCQVIYQEATAQSEVIGYLINLHSVGHRSTAGVTIRAGLEPDAAMICLTLTEGGDACLMWREKQGAEAKLRFLNKTWPKHWLRLERRGRAVVAYGAKDREQWHYLDSVEVDLPERAFGGGVCASSRDDKISYSRLAFLTVRPLAPVAQRLVLREGASLSGRLQGAESGAIHFVFRDRRLTFPTSEVARLVFNPPTSQAGDKLKPGVTGVLPRKGDFIEGVLLKLDADRLQFQSRSGQVKELAWSREAEMLILGEPSPREAAAELLTTAGDCLLADTLVLQTGQVTADLPTVGRVVLPVHELAEIRRLGNLEAKGGGPPQTSIRKTDRALRIEGVLLEGVATFEAGVVRFHLESGETVNLRLDQLAELTRPRALATNGAGAQPDFSWQSHDFSTGRRGAFYAQDRRIIVEAAGRQILHHQDSFYLVALPFRGNGEIRARLAGFNGQGDLARAGLMVREGLEPGARNYFTGLAPGKGAVFQRRNGADGHTEQEVEKGISAPLWLRLQREGRFFSGAWSEDGAKWNPLDSAYTEMKDPYYVGLAVCSGHENRLARAVFEQVRVRSYDAVEYRPRVRLRDGSEIAGTIAAADDSSLKLIRPDGAEIATSMGNVASLIFQPLVLEGEGGFRPGQPGIILRNGDFMDGEFLGLEKDEVRFKSLIFGLRRFKYPDQAAAVILRAPAAPATGWLVELTDGSLLAAREIELRDRDLLLKQPILGELPVPGAAIYSLKRLAPQ